jgi:hypothetical protein
MRQNVTIDDVDPLIAYSSGWTLQRNGNRTNEFHVSATPGDVATITFNGTAIWIYGSAGAKNDVEVQGLGADYSVVVDGKLVFRGTDDQQSPNLLFSTTDLPGRMHHVELTNTQGVPNNGLRLTLDSVTYEAEVESPTTPPQPPVNTTIIIGIVLGIVALIAIIAAAFFLRRLNRASRESRRVDLLESDLGHSYGITSETPVLDIRNQASFRSVDTKVSLPKPTADMFRKSSVESSMTLSRMTPMRQASARETLTIPAYRQESENAVHMPVHMGLVEERPLPSLPDLYRPRSRSLSTIVGGETPCNDSEEERPPWDTRATSPSARRISSPHPPRLSILPLAHQPGGQQQFNFPPPPAGLPRQASASTASIITQTSFTAAAAPRRSSNAILPFQKAVAYVEQDRSKRPSVVGPRPLLPPPRPRRGSQSQGSRPSLELHQQRPSMDMDGYGRQSFEVAPGGYSYESTRSLTRPSLDADGRPWS